MATHFHFYQDLQFMHWDMEKKRLLQTKVSFTLLVHPCSFAVAAQPEFLTVGTRKMRNPRFQRTLVIELANLFTEMVFQAGYIILQEEEPLTVLLNPFTFVLKFSAKGSELNSPVQDDESCVFHVIYGRAHNDYIKGFSICSLLPIFIVGERNTKSHRAIESRYWWSSLSLQASEFRVGLDHGKRADSSSSIKHFYTNLQNSFRR